MRPPSPTASRSPPPCSNRGIGPDLKYKADPNQSVRESESTMRSRGAGRSMVLGPETSSPYCAKARTMPYSSTPHRAATKGSGSRNPQNRPASVALSGDINRHSTRKNGAPPQRVPARLDRSPADQIHLATQQPRKFPLHPLMLEQPPVCVRSERNQKVDIPSARWVRNHRSKQLEFDDPPSLTQHIETSFVRRKPLLDRHSYLG